MNNQQRTNKFNIDNLVSAVEALLLKLGKKSSSFGIIIRAFDDDGNDSHALLREQNNFIVIMPKGESQKALIYGNWKEALYATKRMLSDTLNPQKEQKFVINNSLE